MNKHLPRVISDDKRAEFFRDGVVCLRGVFDEEWIELLKAGLQKNLDAPGDCVAFNGRIIHGGSGALSSDRELRVFNTQWLGDDVRVRFKPHGMDPDHSDKMRLGGMQTGDQLNGDIYPRLPVT